MTVTEEFPPFITVIRVRDRFFACSMVWNRLQERYDMDRSKYAKLRRTRTEASIDAEIIARRQGLEVRE